MKKLFTLMFLMVFAMATSFSQVLISESFESTTFPPAGWSIKDPTSIASFSWYRSGSGSTLGGGAHTGSGVAYANSGDYSSWGHYVSLVTPSFDLTGLNNVKVTFWMYRNNHYVGFVDYIDVYVNTSPTGMGATLLGTIHRHPTLAPAVGSTSGWYECTFYIPSSFNGSTNYVIFDAVSDWGDDMNIDDVVIEVSNPPLPVIAVNPTNGATGVPVNTQLQWDINPAGGSPTLYKVYVGTDNPPTNIANGINTTNRWYNLNNLNTGTQYFWQIVPSNASGTAVGNPIWSFTTATYGSLAGTVYDVDGVTPVAGATVYFTPAVAGVLPQT
ncbi:MAG: choice-of-anchor J domain-containing protein, partial [Bacteroidales bacterium]